MTEDQITESWRQEYEVLGEVLEVLGALGSVNERARVMLMLILRLTPNAFNDEFLMQLVRVAKEPQP